MRKWSLFLLSLTLLGCEDDKPDQPPSPVVPPKDSVETNSQRNAYFGDTHVHTMLSMDAYVFGKGGAIEHTSGYMMQLKKPLDFVTVADHGMYLGMMAELAREKACTRRSRIARGVHQSGITRKLTTNKYFATRRS